MIQCLDIDKSLTILKKHIFMAFQITSKHCEVDINLFKWWGVWIILQLNSLNKRTAFLPHALIYYNPYIFATRSRKCYISSNVFSETKYF